MPEVKSNNITMHYEERGSGVPLILIMGLGAPGSLWEDHVKAYERHFRCILVDNRGAGQTDKPAGPYTTRMMAQDTLGLMDALNIPKAHVSGISMGSTIAQEMALTQPGRIASLTLICSWPRCDQYTVRVFEMLRAMRATADPSAFIRMLQLWIFSPQHVEHHLDALLAGEQERLADPYPMPVHAFQAQCDACIGHDTLDRLKKITLPVLLTVGDRDIFTPLYFSETIAGLIAGSQLRVFKGCGHAHHWEQLDDFNRTTLEFLLAHKPG